MIIDNNTLLPSRSSKYKTIGDLIEVSKTSPRSVMLTIRYWKPSPIRDYIDKYMFNMYYKPNISQLLTYLTARLACLENKSSYREIMRLCFNNVDILSTKDSTSILCDETTNFIKELNQIHGSLTGTFIDYLSRRIICELLKKPFEDSYADLESKLKGRTDISGENNDELYGKFYEKAKNTSDYKTTDIIPDIFIISLCNRECHGDYIGDEKNNIYKKLTNTDNLTNILINPLFELFRNLLNNSHDVLLNPNIGGKLDGFKNTISAYADMVIDDILYDYKCVKTPKDLSDIHQLLGYAALFSQNEKYRKKINKISTLNFLKGTKDTYNIEFTTNENFISFLNILIQEN
jgi:hypothetical protein